MKRINNEYYVSLEVAKLLKETGFDWKCRGIYVLDSENDPEYVFSTANFTNTSKEIEGYIRFSAPVLDIAQRWLREVKHLDVIINRNHPIHEPQYSWEYEYVIIATDGRVKAVDCYFEEYEQAQEAGIKKALEIILDEEE